MEQWNYIQSLAQRSGEREQESIPWITPDPLIDFSYASLDETDADAAQELSDERTAGLPAGPNPMEKKIETENSKPNVSAASTNNSFRAHKTPVIHDSASGEANRASEFGPKPLHTVPAETNIEVIKPVVSFGPFATIEPEHGNTRTIANESIRVIQFIDKHEKNLNLHAMEKPPLLLPEKNIHEQPYKEKKGPEAKLVIGQIIVEVVTPEKKPEAIREKIVERKAPTANSGNSNRPAKFYFGLGQI